MLGTEVYDKFPFLPGMTPMADDLAELVLNRTWRPALSVTGADGMPPLASAGNVLRPHTAVKLSLRLPPTLDGKRAGELLKEALLRDPPYGAQVTLELREGRRPAGMRRRWRRGWKRRSTTASQEFFGKPAMYMGEGGSIPFMGMLGEKFPDAQFMITGVLGPHSNAHGPNEFLHIPMGKRVTACVARVIAEHHAASLRGETTGVAAVAGSGSSTATTAAADRRGRDAGDTQPVKLRAGLPRDRGTGMDGLFGSSNWLYIILIGFIVGVLARLLKPGKDSMGIILTTLLGIAGALLSGWVGQATGYYEPGAAGGFHRRAGWARS